MHQLNKQNLQAFINKYSNYSTPSCYLYGIKTVLADLEYTFLSDSITLDSLPYKDPNYVPF